MSPFWIMMTVLALAVLGYFLGAARARGAAGGDIRRLHSRPVYYGWNAAIATAAPALLVLLVLMLALPLLAGEAGPGASWLPGGAALLVAAVGLAFALTRTTPQYRARAMVERAIKVALIGCSL